MQSVFDQCIVQRTKDEWLFREILEPRVVVGAATGKLDSMPADFRPSRIL